MRSHHTLLSAVLDLHPCTGHASLLASDHIDGPVTIDHPVADITDLYVFPSRDRPGHLTLILDVYPMVPRDGHFSDKVSYSFLVRQADITRHGAGSGLQKRRDDYRVSCTFRNAP